MMNGERIMIHFVDLDKPLTKKQIKMLEELEDRPIVYDDDCPPLTEEQLKSFRRVSEINKEERNKQTVS